MATLQTIFEGDIPKTQPAPPPEPEFSTFAGAATCEGCERQFGGTVYAFGSRTWCHPSHMSPGLLAKYQQWANSQIAIKAAPKDPRSNPAAIAHRKAVVSAFEDSKKGLLLKSLQLLDPACVQEFIRLEYEHVTNNGPKPQPFNLFKGDARPDRSFKRTF